MVEFHYIAKSQQGEEVAGVMQADGESSVARTLDERGLFPVQISENAPTRSFGRLGRIRLREVGVMYGQLGDLLGAGVPLLRALEILAKVGLGDRLTKLVAKVRESVAGGETLADAMAKHPQAFPSLHTAMIRAGERASFLEESLTNLSDLIDRQDDLRSRVRGALVYPLILVVVGSVLVTGILVFFVPKFKPLMQAIDVPLPTVMLFALSDLLRHNLALVLGVAVLIVIALRAYVRSDVGRMRWDRWRIRIPLAGRAVRMVAVTRFCRVLGTMLANGVPILQALAISKDSTGSKMMAESIAHAAENVRGGDPLAEPLRSAGWFPTEIVEMISVGEESNQLERVLVKIADTVERRTTRQVDIAVRIMEPVILLLLAVVVGFVAVGLLYPMFLMIETFQ